MRSACLLLPLLAACAASPSGWDLPPGYERVHGQDFSIQGAVDELHLSDPAAWGWHMDEAILEEDSARATWIEAERGSDYEPPHRSPHTIALLEGFEVGDFVYQLDVENTAPASRGAHRDLCFVFGFQDPANYYYVHLAPGPDDHAHNVFLVDDAARRRVAPVPENGIEWGSGWHRVRIERTLADGVVRVYFDDLETPVIEANDSTHGWGRLGFGTFDDTGRFTNVQVFAPAVRRVEHENPFGRGGAAPR